jgi:Niemann-Pick C1 protein
MALISGFGIGSTINFITFTQLSIPFIVLGLGVDDMFVIMAALAKIKQQNKHTSLPHIIGLSLQKAGTSITITSLTNVVVFLVGIQSQTPSLVAYCTTAAACIFMTYFYVVTFFVAIVTIDEQRIMDRRNFLIPCIQHKPCDDAVENQKELLNFSEKIIQWIYSNIILTKVGRVSSF